MRIAFLGLGNMGSGIASCIRKAGYDLTVWNRTAAKADPLMAAGARRAATPREAVSEADIVITSLMDDRSVVETLAGEGGFLVAMKPGAVHLCVATISPACAEELARLHRDHGTRYVSGPVIGRPDAAAAGQLATYLGGDPEAIKSVKPVCESYARMVVEISPRPSVANMLPCGLSFDHRIVDGAPVGRFVQALTDLLAHPELMLL